MPTELLASWMPCPEGTMRWQQPHPALCLGHGLACFAQVRAHEEFADPLFEAMAGGRARGRGGRGGRLPLVFEPSSRGVQCAGSSASGNTAVWMPQAGWEGCQIVFGKLIFSFVRPFGALF